MTLFALGLEALAVVAALAGGHLAAALAAHLGATAAAVFGLAGARRDERFFTGALVLALPMAGLAGLVVIRVWMRLAPTATGSPEHASVETLPAPERPPESLDAMFAWIQGELAVQPLGDAIRSTNPASQHWAVSLLERRGDAAAVALLREGLHASSQQTQILASSALRRIEERLLHDVERARDAAGAAPSATGRAAVGHACRVFAGSGFAEAAVRARWLDDAAAAYTSALALDGTHRSVTLGLARVWLDQDRPVEAEAMARRAEAQEASPDTDLLVAEALFAQGRWSDLVTTCRAAAGAGREQALIAWWAGAS